MDLRKIKAVFSLKRMVDQGEIPPRGYGFSYRRHWLNVDVFYPFPLNWVIRYARLAWMYIRHAPYIHADDNKVLMARMDTLYDSIRTVEQQLFECDWIGNKLFKRGYEEACKDVLHRLYKQRKSYEHD